MTTKEEMDEMLYNEANCGGVYEYCKVDLYNEALERATYHLDVLKNGRDKYTTLEVRDVVEKLTGHDPRP